MYQGILIPPLSIGRGKITISGEIPGRTIKTDITDSVSIKCECKEIYDN